MEEEDWDVALTHHSMKKLLLLLSLLAGPAHAESSGDVNDRATCSGKIAKSTVDGPDRLIQFDDDVCYFSSKSSIGRQILAACPLDSECEILGRVETKIGPAGDSWGIILRVYTVHMTRAVKRR
jgi:hypothetical protein